MKRLIITIMAGLLLLACPALHAQRVLYIGDSVTDGGWGRSGGSMAPSDQRNQKDLNHIYGHGYMFICAAHYESTQPYAGLQFFNRGISGNTLDDLKNRWQQDVLDLKPDILSVLIGTNDVWNYIKKHDNPDGFDIASWESLYRDLLNEARSNNPDLKIALGTPFVSKTTPQNQQELCARLASAVRRIAKDFHAIVIPFDTMFHELQQSHPNERYWIWDAVHPTPAGHQRMADLWISKATEAGWLLGPNP